MLLYVKSLQYLCGRYPLSRLSVQHPTTGRLFLNPGVYLRPYTFETKVKIDVKVLTLSYLMSTKRSHKLKKTCS